MSATVRESQRCASNLNQNSQSQGSAWGGSEARSPRQSYWGRSGGFGYSQSPAPATQPARIETSLQTDTETRPEILPEIRAITHAESITLRLQQREPRRVVQAIAVGVGGALLWRRLRRTAQAVVIVDLNRADLTGADLAGLDFSHTDLVGTNLSGANLAEANLCAANLSGADLSGANLRSSQSRLRSPAPPAERPV